MKNFIGKDGFIWWIGVVEDILDPLTLGRCKVRCFGYHPAKNKNAVPTEDLPWALTIHSTNTPNLYGTPNVGDWVFGFFMDSTEAQEPAILGYLPGIPQAAQEYFGTAPSLTRNFDRVHTANNSSNTICLEYGNNIIEIVKESSSEANGHLLIQHSTGAKINIESDGKISIYTANGDISISSDDGDINLNAKNINLTATESVGVISGLATSVLAGGLVSLTAGGAFNATSGLYMNMKTLAGILNIETPSSVSIVTPAITASGSITAPIITTGNTGLGTHIHTVLSQDYGVTSPGTG
jgi:hypothetical protein